MASRPTAFSTCSTACRESGEARPDARRGMGIGLSVCRSIIHAHGGEMSVGRSPHGGAAITFYLPCSEENDG